MGTCSANLYKVSSSTTVTLTLKPIDKKVTFKIDKSDSGDKVAVDKFPIGEKALVPFTAALLLVYYMLQISMGYSISTRSIVSKVAPSPTITATGLCFTPADTPTYMSERYVSFSEFLFFPLSDGLALI